MTGNDCLSPTNLSSFDSECSLHLAPLNMCADMVPPLAHVTIAGEYDAGGVPACGHFAGRQADGE